MDATDYNCSPNPRQDWGKTRQAAVWVWGEDGSPASRCLARGWQRWWGSPESWERVQVREGKESSPWRVAGAGQGGGCFRLQGAS